VRYLLKKNWDDNQSKMAEAIGVSQASISQICNGKSEPSTAMLKKIAEVGGVEPNWILTGIGEKSLNPEASLGACIPVCDRLLLDPPFKAKNLKSGYRMEVQARYTSIHHYAYRVKSTDAIKNNEPQGIRPLDILIIDTDRSRFPKLQDYLGTLAVVEGRKRKPVLAHVTHSIHRDGEQEFTADDFFFEQIYASDRASTRSEKTQTPAERFDAITDIFLQSEASVLGIVNAMIRPFDPLLIRSRKGANPE